MKNERTSRKVASIAGRILERLKFFEFNDDSEIFACSGEEGFVQVARRRKLTYPEDGLFSVGELKALAASALTQSPDKATSVRTKGPQPGEPIRKVKARKKGKR